MAGVCHVDKHRFSQISLKLVRFPRALSVESRLKSPCTSLAMRREKEQEGAVPSGSIISQETVIPEVMCRDCGLHRPWRWHWKGNHEWYVLAMALERQSRVVRA